MKTAISINHLTKKYKGAEAPALDSLSLQVGEGEVYGFLGANGAGKSTTIRLLLNFIQPSQGSAKILGHDIVTNAVEVRKHVGYLAGDVALHHKITGQMLIDYLANLSGMKNRDYLHALTERFEAELTVSIKNLSKGNRQKIGIIQAFMHQPAILILDEPTSGLDPLMQEMFNKTVLEAKKRGAAVFLSSHNLTEAQALCDRIGIIRRGKLIHEQVVGKSTTLTTPRFNIVLATKRDVELLAKSPAVTVFGKNGKKIIASPANNLRHFFAALSHYEIESIAMQSINLEDEFMEYYGDKS